MSSRSASVRPISSPTVLMPSRLRQLYERTVRSSSSIGSARSAASCASCGDGPMSMPSAVSSSSRARPNSSTRVEPAEASAVRGRDRRLGLDVDDQPVEVGALLDAGRLDAVGHLEDRRVDRVDRDPADLGTGLLVLRRGDVATATLDGQLHVEPALAVQRGQLEVGVVHGDPGRRLDVAGGDVARALLAQVHGDRLVVLGADAQLLDVHDQLDHVLLDTGDRGELVQDAVDLDAGDRRARDGRQQGTPQGVAQGVPEARLQRFDGEPGPGLADRLLGEGRPLRDEHLRFLRYVGRPLFDANVCAVRRPGRAAHRRLTSSRARRSAAPGPACR